MKLYQNIMVLALASIMVMGVSPIFAAGGSGTQGATGDVQNIVAISATWANGANDTTILLGDLTANNIAKTLTGGTSGEQVLDYSNVAINVTTKQDTNLTSGSNYINGTFKFSARDSGGLTAFTNTYQPLITAWAAPTQGTTPALPVDYQVTVPYNTPAGTYTNTIYTLAQAT